MPACPRRQGGARPLSVLRLSAAVLTVLAALLAGSGARAGEARFEVSMTDYRFEPDRLVVRPGDTVTITLVNKSREREHEFMVGRKVEMGGPFGDRPEGYQEDFFNGLRVELVSAEGLTMLMTGNAKVSGMSPSMSGAGGHGGMAGMGSSMPMAATAQGGRHGFMVQLKPGGKATIRVSVPSNRAGQWEVGCFAEDGQHYTEGMKGTLIVRG